MELLVSLAPDSPNRGDFMGVTPVMLAISQGASGGVVDLLLAGQATRALAQASVHQHKQAALHMVSRKTQASAVAALLKVAPTACTARDTLQRLPLHCAAECHCREDVLQCLLEAYFPAVSQRDIYKRVPLRSAVLSKPPDNSNGACAEEDVVKAVRILAQANRSACADVEPSIHGEYQCPLHLAVASGHSVEVVRTLLAAYGAAAHFVDPVKGWTILHYVHSTTSADTIRVLLGASPAAAVTADKSGRLPLHCAIGAGLNLDAINVLLGANPAAIAIPDRNGSLPLHHISHSTPVDVVSLFIEKHREALSTLNAQERLPLHSCRSCGLLQAVLRAYPQAAAAADADGAFPLHLCVEHGCSGTDDLQELIAAFPAAAASADKHGNLPLHYAGHNSAPVDIVDGLIDAHPAGASAVNAVGDYPLHAALRNEEYPEFQVVEALLKANPQAASKLNFEEKTPLDLFMEVRSSARRYQRDVPPLLLRCS